MGSKFRYIIGDFNLDDPISKHSLVSARSILFDIALRIEIPEGVELDKYPTDSWSHARDNTPLKELNPKAMLHYCRRWVEIEGLLESNVPAHDWWRVLQSDKYRMRQTPYGWVAGEGAICNSKRIRQVDVVANEVGKGKSFNEIIHSEKLSPIMKSNLLEHRIIALNSEFDLRWIGKNFSNVSKQEASRFKQLIAEDKAYIDSSCWVNSKIVLKKGVQCKLYCHSFPDFYTNKPTLTIDLGIGKEYVEEYNDYFTMIFENVKFENIDAKFIV